MFIQFNSLVSPFSTFFLQNCFKTDHLFVLFRIGIGISRSMISRTALRLTNMKNLPKLVRELSEKFSRLVSFVMLQIFFNFMCKCYIYRFFFGVEGDINIFRGIEIISQVGSKNWESRRNTVVDTFSV